MNILVIAILIALGMVLLAIIYIALSRCPYCRGWHSDIWEEKRCQQKHMRKL